VEAGFNVLVPCVWHGRGTSWPSRLAPREPLWEQRRVLGHDPLAYLISAAHRRGVEVHPWFTVVLRRREFLRHYYDEGTPENAFDVHNPGFRALIVSLIGEVAAKYDVDGINLDYIRSVGICKSRACEDSYRRLTRRDLNSDLGRQSVGSDAWKALARWNASAVEEIVQEVRNRLKESKPDATLSVDTHAGFESLVLQGTDAVLWANRGWVDVVYHMDYAGQPDTAHFRNAARQMMDAHKLVFLAGNYERSRLNRSNVWPRDARQVADLVSLGRDLNPARHGVALYDYRFLTDEQAKALRSGPFAGASVPAFSTTHRDVAHDSED
jgi:uncharacterized lipoprotein YddW (UPF0748 family)